jgi:hypothetical protein
VRCFIWVRKEERDVREASRLGSPYVGRCVLLEMMIMGQEGTSTYGRLIH